MNLLDRLQAKCTRIDFVRAKPEFAKDGKTLVLRATWRPKDGTASLAKYVYVDDDATPEQIIEALEECDIGLEGLPWDRLEWL